MNLENDVLNAQQAADALGAHVETIRRLARRGEIPSFKVGKDWRFRYEDLRQWALTFNQRQNPPCILVVDDELTVGRLIRKILAPFGYRVLIAASGQEGLTILENQTVHLVLLDLHMPGMDGLSFLQSLRRDHGALPVIIITGYPDGDLMARALAYGPVMLLAKPIYREPLIQAVRTVLHDARSEAMAG
ncbi:MAG: response regulator [Desulfobacterales bacterium]|jgi:excisionase family DNA binding protein|nr:response regulator [Desulfobacterales bacterium]